jgi:hypothetical protein
MNSPGVDDIGVGSLTDMGLLLARRTLWQDPACPAHLALHPNPYNGNRPLAILAAFRTATHAVTIHRCTGAIRPQYITAAGSGNRSFTMWYRVRVGDG